MAAYTTESPFSCVPPVAKRFLGACLAALLLAVSAAAERPYWPLTGDADALRSSRPLRNWIRLDEDAARTRAEEWVAEGRDGLPQVAENYISLANAAEEERYARLGAAVLDALAAPLLQETAGDPARAITAEGSKDAVNLRMRDLACWLAMRYAAVGDEADAELAKSILIRFAETISQWPLWDRDGNRRAQDDATFHRQWDGRGLWGGWFHADMERSFPLLRAYDLVHAHLSAEEVERIKNNVFRHQKQLIDKWEPTPGNMLLHRLLGMARFGMVLPEPAYVHEVLDLHHFMVYAGFFPDGFFREVSGCYHTMPVGRMTGPLTRLLAGYSDPEGYVHPDTGERLDDLDLSAQYGHHHDRWWEAWDKLTLPNRRTLAVNDATAGRQAWWTRNPPHTQARLLGTSGVAMLGAGGEETPQQLYLLFADTHGHEHRDALHISWFAHGREVFSETNYRPPRGSDSSRAWQAATAGHNTVVIDESNQHGRFAGTRRRFTPDDVLTGRQTWRWRQRAMNKPNLLLFDHRWPPVQAVEAEAERSYAPTAELYRRTLALADLGGGDGYLVDIFRVRGGSRHDYMLHGCLDEEYQTETDVPLEGAETTLYNYIRVHSRGYVQPPFSFSFAYQDGLKTITRVLSPRTRNGNGVKGVHLNIGKAPAMRRVGHANFVALRRHGGAELDELGQDNIFVLVHESTRSGESRIASADLLPHESDDPEAVALRVTLADGREDVYLSTLGEGSVQLEDGTRFQGRLGFVRRQNGRTLAARIFDGQSLVSADEAARIEGLPAIHGRVVATKRVDNGDPGEAVVVEGLPPRAGDLAGRTLFVEMDEDRDYVWAYRIENVQPDGDRAILWVEHDPGIEIQEGGALTKLMYHPGWGFRSPAYFRIASSGTWEAE